jgi:hypothetical protein
MFDILYIGLTIIFLAVTWGFIVACGRLMDDRK